MTKTKFISICIATGVAVTITATGLFLLQPQKFPISEDQKLKLYKKLYVKYVRIFKSNLSSRFNDAELKLAIEHAKGQPWVQKQIADDLAPFKDGISQDQVDRWFVEQQDTINKLVKFTVKNGKVSATKLSSKYIYAKTAYKTVYQTITLLASKGYIPDCEFIIALNDYLVPTGKFDEPAAIMTFAKHNEVPVEKTTILIPDWMNMRYWDVLKGRIALANQIYPWQNKKPLIHWRGGLADSMGHRQKLVELNDKLDFLDVGITQALINPAKHLDPEFSVAYKYQISLDGARCTWERMIWQMASNSVMLKPESPQVQWFHGGLEPYKNYVPVADVDENNIRQVYGWLEEHDTEVQQIINNANDFADANFKTQDFVAYYALLLQEYAKLYKAS
jgi:hypothetical protein